MGINFTHAGGIDKKVMPAIVGSGCAFADYDNDGDLDLYLSNYKANVFFKNQGNGIFKKASSSAGGIGDERFGSSIGWADYDNDGFLDLYVGNYLDYGKIPQGKETFFPYDFFGQT